MAVNITQRLVLDRIRFYVEIGSYELYQGARAQLLAMASMQDELIPGGSIETFLKPNKSKVKQRVLVYRPDGKRAIAVIKVGLSPGKKHFFSLDLYPSRFLPGEFSRFQEILGALLEDFNYTKLYMTAPVTYAEFAVDSLSDKMGSLIPVLPKSTYSWVCDAPDGDGGIYVGALTGDRFVIYDKQRQLAQVDGVAPHSKYQTRIEARLRSLKLPAAAIPTYLPNPFLRLRVVSVYSLYPLLKDKGYDGFLDQIFKVGPSEALKNHSQAERKFLIRQLRKSEVWWWRPDDYWKRLPDAVTTIIPDQ